MHVFPESARGGSRDEALPVREVSGLALGHAAVEEVEDVPVPVRVDRREHGQLQHGHGGFERFEVLCAKHVPALAKKLGRLEPRHPQRYGLLGCLSDHGAVDRLANVEPFLPGKISVLSDL